MNEPEGPAPLTAEWWTLRRAYTDQIAANQKRCGIKWTDEQRANSKRSEYFALHGREPEAEEKYANTSHWSDR